MNPEIWGPHAWIFLHMITFNYPENPTLNDKNNMKSFFNNLSNVLPCETCGLNLKKHLIQKPLNDDALSSRRNLIKWLYDIHNMVNLSIGKKYYSYSDFIKKYKNIGKNNNYIYYILSIIVCVVIILLIIIFVPKNWRWTDKNYTMGIPVKNIIFP